MTRQTDLNHDTAKRKAAWYYARTGRAPITESRGLIEGIAFARGRARAEAMLAELRRGGRAPKRGVSLRACGFDGEPCHEAMIEDQRRAGVDAWFEYVGHGGRDVFEIHELV